MECRPPGGGPALRGARARRDLRAPELRARAPLSRVLRPHPQARRLRRRTALAPDRLRRVLRPAAPPPARVLRARIRGGQPARDGAGGARDDRAATVAGHRGGGAADGCRVRSIGDRTQGGLVRLFNRHRVIHLLLDACFVALAWYLAFALRFDFRIPDRYDNLIAKTIFLVVALKIGVFVLSGFYNHWWRYVSTRDMWSAARGVVLASLLVFIVIYLVEPVENVRLPRSVFFTDTLLLLALVTGARLLARTLMERPGPASLVAHGKEALVVGAGDAGQLVLKEMLKNRALGYTPIGVVDDDPRKKNLRLHGVRVLGATCRSRTCSAAKLSISTSRRLLPISRERRCSSRGLGDRSAQSSAARSRRSARSESSSSTTPRTRSSRSNASSLTNGDTRRRSRFSRTSRTA